MRRVFRNKNKLRFYKQASVGLLFLAVCFFGNTNVHALSGLVSGRGTAVATVNIGPTVKVSATKYHCGYFNKDSDKNQSVETSFDIGCKGKGNPITDATFAIIRFLSIGVGLVIVASLIYAGIQYTSSQGDPKATAEAIGRIRSNVVAFILFIFGYAILNYLIPVGFLGQ